MKDFLTHANACNLSQIPLMIIITDLLILQIVSKASKRQGDNCTSLTINTRISISHGFFQSEVNNNALMTANPCIFAFFALYPKIIRRFSKE